MDQAVAGQKLARPYIGIRYEMLDLQRANRAQAARPRGRLRRRRPDRHRPAGEAVVPDGPAAKAGVKQGDIIVAIDGQAIDTEHPLDSVLTQFAPGETVTLGVLRDGQKVEVQVTLGVRPADL